MQTLECRAIQDLRTRTHTDAADPTRQDRFAFQLCKWAQPLGGFRRLGHCLRRKNDKQPIIVFVSRNDLNGLCVRLWTGVAEDINRIASAPVRRQKLV
jgi:hypothetical protein